MIKQAFFWDDSDPKKKVPIPKSVPSSIEDTDPYRLITKNWNPQVNQILKEELDLKWNLEREVQFTNRFSHSARCMPHKLCFSPHEAIKIALESKSPLSSNKEFWKAMNQWKQEQNTRKFWKRNTKSL